MNMKENLKTKIMFLHSGAELYGADQILLTVVSNIDKSKFEPIVVLPNEGPLVSKLIENGIRVEIIPYPIIRRKYFNIKGILNYFFEYSKSIKVLYQFVKTEQIDIIYSNTIAVLEGVKLSKKTKLPLVVHIHEMLDKPRIVAKILYKIFTKKAHIVIAVSNAVKMHIESIINKKSEKITVIHNGIDISKFETDILKLDVRKKYDIPSDAIVLGMIGRINEIKGQTDFIEMAKRIVSKNKNVYAIIVGDAFQGQEWRVDELKKQIKDETHIFYLGFQEEIPSIHSNIDIFVLPSVKYDSFPTVVLEAMASSTPVVAYKSGGVEEMIVDGYNGYLVEQGDIDNLVSKVEKIICDDSFSEFGENSLKIVREKFTQKVFTIKIENLLNGVLNNDKR